VHPSTTGRSVAAALADPRPADLPRPSGMAWGIAAVLVLGGLGLALRLAGRRPSRWPWWFLIALATIPLLADAPTLSNPAVYPRVPTRLWLAASPAALVLAIVSFRDLRAQGPATTLAVQLAPAVAWVAAAFVLSVLPAVGPTTVVMPPLVPDWTAHTSVSLAVLAAAAVVLAGVVTASSRRPSPPVRSRPPSEP
jgi:hypothetical protein